MNENEPQASEILVSENPTGCNQEMNGAELPPHLIRLPESRWALWRCIGVRGAGFPLDQLLKLSATHCAAAADQVLEAEIKAQQARSEAIRALEDELEMADPTRHGALEKALRRLQKNKISQPPGVDGLGGKAQERFREARASVDLALSQFQQAFEIDTAKLAEAIRDVAASPRFREAVIWQNRNAFHNGIDSLLRRTSDGSSRGSKYRQHEEMVAKYLQRYCAKNDTIGFFGPMGWAEFSHQAEAIEVRPGPHLIAARKVYFEGWCIDALAEKIATNKALQPWIAPRRRPWIRLEGNSLHVPFGGTLKLSPDHAAVLQACDGKRLAKQIAAELVHDPSSKLRSESEVYSLLEFFRMRRVIFWEFEIPVEAQPELTLKQLLQRIEDEREREPAMSMLAQLLNARAALSAAAGDAEKVDRAMSELEATFTRLTGKPPTRLAGSTYAARTLVYEDCRRDLELKIGPKILQSLAPPLRLLLDSARWLTSHAFSIYRKTFEDIYRELAREKRSSMVDILSFWLKIHQLILQNEGEPLDSLVREFQKRWLHILPLPSGQRHLHFNSKEIDSQARAMFGSTDQVSQLVRYYSPDVMIAADSVEAMRRGDYQFVLGELHVAINTLSTLMFVEQHPSPEDFSRAWNLDIPEQHVVPILPKNFFGGAMRTNQILKSPRQLRLDLAAESPGDLTYDALPVGEFVIEDQGSGPVVRTYDCRLRFDLMEFFAMAVVAIVTNSFKLIGQRAYTPRVSIDRMVISRESWSFTASEFAFGHETDSARRYLHTRRWAAAYRMPRFVFVRTPIERKPFYLDFDSPIYIDIFNKIMRRISLECPENALVTITEMLPLPTQIWLPDAENNLYTNEFRMIALDLTGWSNKSLPPIDCFIIPGLHR